MTLVNRSVLLAAAAMGVTAAAAAPFVDRETETHHGVHEIVRLTPKKAPFRRGNVHFKSLEPVVVRLSDLTGEQLLKLVEEPLVDVDASHDGGDTWRRHSLQPEALPRPVTTPALSPERAIDPTAAIVPRAPVRTRDGVALPPEAADPAVPIAPAEGDIEELRTLHAGEIADRDRIAAGLRTDMDGLHVSYGEQLAERDRIAVGLRSEMEGLHTSYGEQIGKLRTDHASEIEALKAAHEKAIAAKTSTPRPRG